MITLRLLAAGAWGLAGWLFLQCARINTWLAAQCRRVASWIVG